MEKKESLVKKFLKKKKLIVTILVGLIVIILLGLLISKTNLRRLLSNISVSDIFKSDEVKYDNSESDIKSSNMQGAIDELYTKCLELKNKCPDDYVCTPKEDIDLIDSLKESIKSAEAKDDESINDVINEAKNAIIDNDITKIKESKAKLDELL